MKIFILFMHYFHIYNAFIKISLFFINCIISTFKKVIKFKFSILSYFFVLWMQMQLFLGNIFKINAQKLKLFTKLDC